MPGSGRPAGRIGENADAPMNAPKHAIARP
jgi:hypothetical protein